MTLSLSEKKIESFVIKKALKRFLYKAWFLEKIRQMRDMVPMFQSGSKLIV